MSRLHVRKLAAFSVAFVLVMAPSIVSAEIVWPKSLLSRHVQAWFAQLRGTEADARRFFTEHIAPAALVDAPVEERLQRRTMTIERTQGLTPLEVVNDDPAAMDVRCKAGNGDQVVAMFEAEPAPPHRIVGVRLEAVGPGGEGAPRQAVGPPLEAAEVARQTRAHLDARAAAGDFSGVALLVRGDSTLLAQAWGLADREKNAPAKLDTRFNVGSIGKLFTRAALAQLAQAGKLSLDDKLSRYLPDFPHADAITLDMLCEHRSGVGDFFNAKYDAMDRSKLRHNRDYLTLIREQPLWFAPGTSQRYSNGGYALLGEVIARASGEDYYDYLARHVFGPAGMSATGAPIEGDGTRGLARGYTREGAASGGERDNVATRPARGSAAGGGYSTATDLLAFDRALLAGRLCGRRWTEWVTGGPRPDRGAAAAGGDTAFGFGGGAPGIAAEWLHNGDAVLIVLTNRDPEVTQPVVRPLRELLQRMKPAPRRRPS